jgi:hypothetical protein
MIKAVAKEKSVPEKQSGTLKQSSKIYRKKAG